MNYFTVEMMLKEKRKDMLQEAKRLRMVSDYERSMRNRKGAFGLHVAELLIRLGESMRKRYDRKVELPSNC